MRRRRLGFARGQTSVSPRAEQGSSPSGRQVALNGRSARSLTLRGLRQQASKGKATEITSALVLRGEYSLAPQDEGWRMAGAANTLPLMGRVGPKSGAG